MELYKKSAAELAGLLRKKEVSATDIAQAAFARMEATEAKVGAFLHAEKESALKAAADTDKRIAANEPLAPLAGIPVGLKDNICYKGMPTTCASRMLENFRPFYNATVVEKLKQAGAVFPGKLNMDEFAMGSSCETSYFQQTKNPWDLSRVPGGSSGGSSAAVAACQLPLALGTDTGGSIRLPSSFCGVVGLKPTYGAVSRYGVVAFASSLDQVGPIARTVSDAALLLSVIAGPDRANDATSKDFTFGSTLDDSIKGLTIGVPKEYYAKGVNPEVKAAVEKGIAQMEALGANVVETSLTSTHYALSAYYVISSAEAASNLARYDGVEYGFVAASGNSLEEMYVATRSQGFGDEVKRRIMLGTYVLSSGYYDAYYKRAKLLQRQIAAEFDAAFEKCDLLITPTGPSTAYKLQERANDPLEMYMGDMLTVPLNIAGLPGISVPCGLDGNALPIGMQIIGPKWSEKRLLTAAKCYETAVGGFPVKEMDA